ncbi:metallophosphoesterase [Larsenimonas salina]|uniref:metallophosphoesterase n=1 Tax=Larsenimonas salina TaxID=1295565 RepID=UPI002073F147|nr:metallophosphoesterase [Larsenimonas salina]MCM5703434.1 metallophosphoesterase [Larsenimonas salina]
MLEHIAQNTQGRDFVVGDLHGEYDQLMALLEEVQFDKTCDRLFAVGDLIDRGPDSMKCLALMREPWFFSVQGNHEAMAIKAMNGEMWHQWQENGGRWVLKQNPPEVAALLKEAVAKMAIAYEIETGRGRVGIVHADPPLRWQVLETQSEDVKRQSLWSRKRYSKKLETPVEGIDAVIVGHTIVASPVMLGNVRYIDTGAFTSNKLTLEPLTHVLDLLAG